MADLEVTLYDLENAGESAARAAAQGESEEILRLLDEVTALASGHRPCFECRRADFNRYAQIWGAIRGRPERGYVKEMDALMHRERLNPNRSKRLHARPYGALPDGAFVLEGETPCLVLGDALLEWSFGGYRAARSRPKGGDAQLITPPSAVEVIGGTRLGITIA